MSKTIKIDQDQSGQRLDKFLASMFPNVSRAKWQKSIKNGEIFLNGTAAKPDYTLKKTDVIEISEQKEKKALVYKTPDIKVLYEDENTIVLDKPAGIPVHGAKTYSGPTVVDFLIDYFPQMKNVGEDSSRPGIVHRLDKDTSGVMVVAKNNNSFQFLKDQFKNRLAKKTYLALVYGNVQKNEGMIDFPIGRSKSDPKKQTVIDSRKKKNIKSKKALTYFKVVNRFNGYTLIEAEPKTGRMHQIRVHLKALGHPIVGDKKYFLKKYAKQALPIDRQFLHASSLEITLFQKNKTKFRSSLPKNLDTFLNSLQSLL